MPCPCNQAKINAINAEITAKQTQKTKINELKGKVDSMILNYTDCLEHLACVETNLANNSTEAGKKFDNGDVATCVNDINKEMLNWEERSKTAKNNMDAIDVEIQNLEASKANYQGDCPACYAEYLAKVAMQTGAATTGPGGR